MILRRIARPLLATIFVSEGIESLRDPGSRVEAAEPVIDLVADITGLGGHREAGAALLASVMTRSLPRLATEIATLGSPAATGRRADERQMAATEAALARSLGRLNEMIEHSAVPRPALAAATAEAGAAAAISACCASSSTPTPRPPARPRCRHSSGCSTPRVTCWPKPCRTACHRRGGRATC